MTDPIFYEGRALIMLGSWKGIDLLASPSFSEFSSDPDDAEWDGDAATEWCQEHADCTIYHLLDAGTGARHWLPSWELD
jgi:hypothetical protein